MLLTDGRPSRTGAPHASHGEKAGKQLTAMGLMGSLRGRQTVAMGAAGPLCFLLSGLYKRNSGVGRSPALGCLTLASQSAVIRPFSTVTSVEKVLWD